MKELRNLVLEEIAVLVSVFQSFASDENLVQGVVAVGEACSKALASGNKIMLAGNGGSAADSQHIAAEFVSKLANEREPLPAIALTTDSSIITAAANDYGFEKVFERQVLALARKGDVFIGISTSGNSLSVLRALDAARNCGAVTVALTGNGRGKICSCADHVLEVPSSRTQNIQEVHIMIGHTICAIAERDFVSFEENGSAAQ